MATNCAWAMWHTSSSACRCASPLGKRSLAKPLAERQAFARGLRAESAARKGSGATYADVDTAAALSCLHAHGASTLIHGHTHRPGEHVLDADAKPPLRRLVLSDWDAFAQPPRLEVLRLQTGHTPRRVALTA
jgi:UDP-2,3-diacylglucosamine hydrolase